MFCNYICHSLRRFGSSSWLRSCTRWARSSCDRRSPVRSSNLSSRSFGRSRYIWSMLCHKARSKDSCLYHPRSTSTFHHILRAHLWFCRCHTWTHNPGILVWRWILQHHRHLFQSWKSSSLFPIFEHLGLESHLSLSFCQMHWHCLFVKSSKTSFCM